MKSFGRIVATAALLTGLGFGTAYADACSGRSHDTGTAVGAVGGAAIGGLASHSVVGAVVGGVAGGLAGNAIARSNDCNSSRRVEARRRYYVDRHGHRHYYRR
jgi:outer membrane lipoprotein SlyB